MYTGLSEGLVTAGIASNTVGNSDTDWTVLEETFWDDNEQVDEDEEDIEDEQQEVGVSVSVEQLAGSSSLEERVLPDKVALHDEKVDGSDFGDDDSKVPDLELIASRRLVGLVDTC